MEKNYDTKETLLFSSLDELEIEQACAILSEHNIPFIRRDSGSGSYMNLYMGNSIQEKNIFVNNEDVEKALELISFLFNNEKTENEEETEKKGEDSVGSASNEEDDDDYDKKYNNIKTIFKIFLILIFTIPICIGILLLLVVIMQSQ